MEPQRFSWRARRWGEGLIWVAMPFAVTVPIIGRRLEGRPLATPAEAVFFGFAIVFSLLLFRAHLGPTQVLTVDEEGVWLDSPRSLLRRHLWRLGWSEIARAVVVTGADARTLVFEPVRPVPRHSQYGLVLASEGLGISARVEDEGGLLAALGRRVPVVVSPAPFAVTGGREFVRSGPGIFSPWMRAFLGVAALTFLARPFYTAWTSQGLGRLVWFVIGVAASL